MQNFAVFGNISSLVQFHTFPTNFFSFFSEIQNGHILLEKDQQPPKMKTFKIRWIFFFFFIERNVILQTGSGSALEKGGCGSEQNVCGSATLLKTHTRPKFRRDLFGEIKINKDLISPCRFPVKPRRKKVANLAKTPRFKEEFFKYCYVDGF